MNRASRRAWRSARTLDDLGALVARWLRGEITHTPGHAAPPDPETTPHIGVLTEVNRAGFITDNSQAADGPWEAWASGFAADDALSRLREAVSGTPLVITRHCRGREHHGCQGWRWWRWGCPARDAAGSWADASPAVAAVIRRCWHVTISDPEPGREDRLWPALAQFARKELAP